MSNLDMTKQEIHRQMLEAAEARDLPVYHQLREQWLRTVRGELKPSLTTELRNELCKRAAEHFIRERNRMLLHGEAIDVDQLWNESLQMADAEMGPTP